MPWFDTSAKNWGRVFMRIAGEWQIGHDGIIRPILEAHVAAADGTLIKDDFLIDSGADRTVFSAGLMDKLGLQTTQEAHGFVFSGIGGQCAFVVVTTVIELIRDDGGPARINGQFAAFTDPAASDISILGRDVLNHFDLILSRPRSEIFFLSGNHRYVVQQA